MHNGAVAPNWSPSLGQAQYNSSSGSSPASSSSYAQSNGSLGRPADRPMPSRSLTADSAMGSERERQGAPSSMSRSEDLNHTNRRLPSSDHPSSYDDFILPPQRPSSSGSHGSNSSSTSSSKLPPSSTAASSAASQQTPSTLCNACGRAMQGSFVRALGTVFHLTCFKCLDCGDVVASKFFPIDGPDGKQSPLCERDYFRRLNLICAKCGTALRGNYITACNKKFHVEHFTCSICPTLFGPQDSYYEHDGDVFCHFHYSTRFATKCAGCNSAILKQFVEINRNMRDECWHPECYMINKFWNVKVVSRRPQSIMSEEETGDPDQPAYVEEEGRESAVTLKEKQSRMEQQVYRIWTVLSAFEESSAACISDMLRHVSNGQYLDAIRMADKFILHVEVLFATIDDLEWHFARLNLKGMSHVREARMLCRKTVELFTLLSHTQETGQRRMGMTQELLALVTGLAHYLKILIRIALTGALKLEREYNAREAMSQFLDKLHLLAVQGGNPTANRVLSPSAEMNVSPTNGNLVTQGVTYGFRSLAPENAGESPFSVNRDHSNKGASSPPSDLCIHCRKTVEEDCVRLGTYQRWHSQCIQCQTCGVTAAPPQPVKETSKDPSKSGDEGKDPSAPKLSTARRAPANVELFVYEGDTMRETSSFGEVPTVVFCTQHGHSRCRAGFIAVPRLEQYAFLLNVALRRLYLLLKKQGVVPISPISTPEPLPSNDRDPYRNSSDMRMQSRLDRKLSATARIPKRSTIVESPTGRIAQADDVQRMPTMTAGPAQQGSLRQPQPKLPPQMYQQPAGVSGSRQAIPQQQQQPPPPPQQQQQQPPPPQQQQQQQQAQDSQNEVLRPAFARYNTGVMIREDTAPLPPSSPPMIDPLGPGGKDSDTITLADLPFIMDAPRKSATPYIAELSPLELALVKHAALGMLARGPLRDHLEMDELLESIEIKKGGFWNKLFKGDKKNVKKKGVFGVPLELLVEREGSDSVLGATRETLRIPSFIDDVVSAMRQMDMSIEGIFRKNGNIRRLKDVIEAIDRDASAVDLTTDNPVQLAALLKKFLGGLPDPLLTFKLYRLLTATQALDGPEKQRQLHFVSLLLPKSHRDTMEVLFVFLRWVASFAHVMDGETGSKMDLGNLATVICPSILYSRGRDAVKDDQFGAIDVITQLLTEQDVFLTVPLEFMPIIKDQELFANAMELPSKDFLKKVDNYMKGKQTSNGSIQQQHQQQQQSMRGGGPPPMGGQGYPNGSGHINGGGRMQSPGPPGGEGRPPLGMQSSERLVRPHQQHPHPGMPGGSMSYPPPSPSLGQGQGPPQRPAPPDESLQWNPASGSRPTSYAQPRPPPAPPSGPGGPSELPYS